ncbi:hypothetical protein SDC9_88802 [bioreactor metagenome]|uniref:Uncharacterized protein n=1 Tax=bioreactor metagenome TaxID=1076179 RepID=A0A644ZMI6_9ZZZZ
MHVFGRESAAGFDHFKAEKVPAGLHVAGGVDKLVKDDIPQADVEQAQPDHHQTHDRTGTERDLKSAVEAFAGRLRGPAAGGGGGAHADVAAQAGEEAPGQERDRNEGILDAEEGQYREKQRENDENDTDDAILTEQVSHGAFPDVTGDFAHLFRAFIGRHHLLVENAGDDQRGHAGQRRDQPDQPQGVGTSRRPDRLGVPGCRQRDE